MCVGARLTMKAWPAARMLSQRMRAADAASSRSSRPISGSRGIGPMRRAGDWAQRPRRRAALREHGLLRQTQQKRYNKTRPTCNVAVESCSDATGPNCP